MVISINLLLLLILPLLFSGIIHHFFIIKNNLLKFLKIPIDLGASIRGKRIFGDSKTFRGFFVVIVFTSFFTFLFSFIFPSVVFKLDPLISGALFGLGYSVGELPTSFIKRQLGIKIGRQEKGLKGFIFYSLEQIDSITGALIVAQFLVSINIVENLFLFIIGTGLHLFIDLALYFRGYKRNLDKPFYLKSQTN
jgi:hypothetical protein